MTLCVLKRVVHDPFSNPSFFWVGMIGDKVSLGRIGVNIHVLWYLAKEGEGRITGASSETAPERFEQPAPLFNY